MLNLEQETAGRAEATTRFFDQLSSEMRYLVSSSALRDLASVPMPENDEGREGRRRVTRDFAAFAQAYPYIYQIRYLDITGREIVRVDNKEGKIIVIPEKDLQDKSDRYYVQETLSMMPGEIYVSPLDLNVERGEPEYPEKPVIRFGTPIIDGEAKSQGMLMINLHAGIVLDQVRQMAEAREGMVYLFSRSGFYLSRSQDRSSHSVFEMKSLEELTGVFSRPFLSRILSGVQGTDEQGEWIVAFAPVRNTNLRGGRLTSGIPKLTKV